MFTGIVEATGILKKAQPSGTNLDLFFESPISHELKVDQSICHNGVCLTVTKAEGRGHWVTAVDETLKKSNLGRMKVGEEANLERCMPVNGRFDGHIVQGHVDATADVLSVSDQNGSWLFRFQMDDDQLLIVEKGSITVNGVSLTCFDITKNQFSVAIIPYTFQHTNFQRLLLGHPVNIEFDIVGKYVQRLLKEGAPTT